MDGVSETKTIRKLHWALLPMICVMIGCCRLDRSNVAYMQLQLRHPPPVGLSFSSSLYGNAAGLFFLSYSALQIPSTLVVARVGAPMWLAGIMTLWGITASLLAAVRGSSQFLLLRLLLGAFEAGTFPGIWYHVLLFYPPQHLTVAMGAMASSIMVSQVVAAPVAAALFSLDGVAGLRGWQWIAVAEGGATAAAGLLLKFVLPTSPADVRALSAEEVAWVESHVTGPPTTAKVLAGLRSAVTSRMLWLLTCLYTLKAFALYALIFWLPIVVSDLLRSRRGGPAGRDLEVVLLTMVPYACAAASAYLMAWSSQTRAEIRWHTSAAFSIAAVSLLAAPLLQGPEMAVPAFVALTVALCMANSTAAMTAAVPASLPSAAQAGGLALYNSIANVGGYFGPAAFGWLKESTGGNATGMVVMGLVMLAGGVAMATLYQDPVPTHVRGQGAPSHSSACNAADEPLLPSPQTPAPKDDLKPVPQRAGSHGSEPYN